MTNQHLSIGDILATVQEEFYHRPQSTTHILDATHLGANSYLFDIQLHEGSPTGAVLTHNSMADITRHQAKPKPQTPSQACTCLHSSLNSRGSGIKLHLSPHCTLELKDPLARTHENPSWGFLFIRVALQHDHPEIITRNGVVQATPTN